MTHVHHHCRCGADISGCACDGPRRRETVAASCAACVEGRVTRAYTTSSARTEAELARQRRRIVDAVGAVLAANGCECECGHRPEEHDDDCERCLACRIEAALRGAR